jgi:hypothetical protein
MAISNSIREASSQMKVIALAILLLMLALIASGARFWLDPEFT